MTKLFSIGLFLIFGWLYLGCTPPQSYLEKNLPEGVFKGAWVTNVGSDVLLSEDNIKSMISQCKKYKIDQLFVVVWNKGVTQYPSDVLEKYTGIRQESLLSHFDPLKSLIEQAHQQGMKVHAWFEFGFSFAYNDPNSIWIKKYPEWLGRDQNGKILKKNNFMWWNALHPGPQEFLLELVEEVVTNYDIDGIQGDDRLPAMPSEGGYDSYTKSLFRDQFNTLPPQDHKDPDWIKWRSTQLNGFAKKLYEKVKSIDPTILVSWAPSIYPWSEEEYLQSWPDWIRGGYADFVVPQFYRYKLEDYTKIIDQLDDQLTPQERSKIYAGVLTALGGGYRINDSLLVDMVNYHRSRGIEGEVFFYFEKFNRQNSNNSSK
jgi:uncharacterized lipoprotein YddW (UPF0748 family)